MTHSPPRREDAAPPKRDRPGAGAEAIQEKTFGGVEQNHTPKNACDQALHDAPERLAGALAATLHGLYEVRHTPAPGALSAALAAVWRNRLGDGERAFLAATGAESLDPEPLLDLGHAIQDQFDMAPGHEIERRRLAMVERWRREREGMR